MRPLTCTPARLIGVPSMSAPAIIAAVDSSGVYPVYQTDLLSLVVPVLPAEGTFRPVPAL